MRRFDCCTKSIEKIASKSTRPFYFFTQALTLNEKIKSLLPTIYPIYEDLVLAIDWHHKVQHGMEFCKQTKNYARGMKWEHVSNVLISFGVKSFGVTFFRVTCCTAPSKAMNLARGAR